jgi:tetratricopeptide repeat protein/cytochrome c554/c'-like protein
MDIFRSFSSTRMGRSLVPATPELIRGLSLPASIYDRTLDRHYEIFSQNGRLYQDEYQSGSDGAEVFRNTQQVQWIIGAGANGLSAIVQRGNYLFEAPLSYYAAPEKWALSPGYEGADLGFSRPILAGCISCHSGLANPADETTGRFDPNPFSQMAVGCENCHGPGAAHIGAMKRDALGSDTRIVNPKRLSADLENDICMSCHEAGDARILRPGKTFQDFRPGQQLDDTFSIFMVPLKRGDPDNRDHVQHYFEMSMSRCFRGSGGQLRCATCHDPHVEPGRDEVPAYFNAKCLECHRIRSCTQSPAERQKTKPADNCIGCHMPRRDSPETIHTSLTNHRILRNVGEPWPEEAFNQTTAGIPDLVHINRSADGTSEIDPPVLLEAYRQIAERRPDYGDAYQRVLSDLEQTDPDQASVQEGLGRRALGDGDPVRAVAHFERACALNPKSASAYSYLSQALLEENKLEEAIEASRKAISLSQFNSLYRRALIEQLIAAKEYQKAIDEMELYLELFPEDSFMRKMLEVAMQ